MYQRSEIPVTQARARQDCYLYHPLDVPAGVRSLRVRYAVSDPSTSGAPPGTGNVVDAGLFAPGDTFRGWSGSARDEFAVTDLWATPGYLAGPVVEGPWKIIFGLYRIMPQGATLVVEVEMSDSAEPRPVEHIELPGPSRTEAGWYRGDLHSHTQHSDARATLTELLTVAQGHGLEFLGVTDHNTVSHHPVLRAAKVPLTPIAGEEVTTYHGHATLLGCQTWCDFRIQSRESLLAAVRQGREGGGTWVVAHPKRTGCDWAWGDDLWPHFDAVEVWNGPWPTRNWESVNRWHERLCIGDRLACVGGSDRHQVPLPDTDPAWKQVGFPTTWVWSDGPSAAQILAAIRAGRTCVGHPTGRRIWWELYGQVVTGATVKAGTPVVLKAIKAEYVAIRVLTEAGVVLDGDVDNEPVVEVPVTARGRFMRAEIYWPRDDVAWHEHVQALEKTYGVPAAEAARQPEVFALSGPVYVQ